MMKFFKKLFIGEEKSYEFTLEWAINSQHAVSQISNPYILITEYEKLSIENITPIYEKCSTKKRPLLIISPDITFSRRLNEFENNVFHIHSKSLNNSTERELLEDIAILTQGRAITKDLGYGLNFPNISIESFPNTVIIPTEKFEQLELEHLGKCSEVTIHQTYVVFSLKFTRSAINEVKEWVNILAANRSTKEISKRLSRFENIVGSIQDQSGETAIDETTNELPFCLSSTYFVTQKNPFLCKLADAKVVIISGPLSNLNNFLPFIDNIAREKLPIFILTQSVSDEILALCVNNKLKGVLSCGIATYPQNIDAMKNKEILSFSQNTHAPIIKESTLTLSDDNNIESILGNSKLIICRPD